MLIAPQMQYHKNHARSTQTSVGRCQNTGNERKIEIAFHFALIRWKYPIHSHRLA